MRAIALIAVGAMFVLTGCGVADTPEPVERTVPYDFEPIESVDIGGVYWQDEVPLTDGRKVTCIRFRGGLSCDWSRSGGDR